MADGVLILAAGAVLTLGVAATLVAGRLRVPGLVLFLGLGMLLGSGGLGLVHFDNVELARTLGVIALSLILFEGGLAAGWSEIRPVLGTGLTLATLGTFITAILTGLAASWLLDLSLLQGLLLGSIVSATDSAAIFSVLRGSSIRRRLARTLEAESGMNDPVAVLLVLGFIALIQSPGYGVADFLTDFATQLAIGGAVGALVGRGAVTAFTRARFASTGLYPVASIASAAIGFGAADVLGGSGFFAVYLTGLALGGQGIPAKQTIEAFHSGVGWVSQIGLFFALGLLVRPDALGAVAVDGVILAVVLTLVARPLAVLVSTRVGAYPLRDALLISWAGLRGAIPIVLATFPVIAGIEPGQSFFNLVFFVVLFSTLLQGATFEPLARWLGLTASEPALPPPIIEGGTIRRLGAEVLEHPVGDDDAIVGRRVNELGLPREALVSVIVRAGQALLPRGSTEIEAGDRLHILVRQPVRALVEQLFGRWRDGPIAEPPPAPLRPRGRSQIFSVGRWRPADGDPASPAQVAGVAVIQHLRTRRGRAGALVQLEDGRFAVTDEEVVAVGGPRQLYRYCRERIGRADGDEPRAWFQEVAGALSDSPRR